MKTNKILYTLLFVLIIMNGFFLFNYLGKPNHKGPKEASNFIAKELKFNNTQLEQFNKLENEHHKNMRIFGDATKEIKDELFKTITAPSLNEAIIDSLVLLISEKEKLKEKELFNNLRHIYELCNAQQKKTV